MTVNEGRCTYQDLKNQALDAYYEFCRDEVTRKKPSHMEVLARVGDHFEGTLNYPLEELMFCVIELVLSGGWHEDVERNCRVWIEAWKAKNCLRKLIGEIPVKEAELFMHDAKTLELFI